jgi:hypothetical protein
MSSPLVSFKRYVTGSVINTFTTINISFTQRRKLDFSNVLFFIRAMQHLFQLATNSLWGKNRLTDSL